MDSATSTTPSPLSDLLYRAGLKQADLARLLNLGRSTINQWCGDAGVPAERVGAICDALQLGPAEAADFARAVGVPLPKSVEAVVLGAA